MTYSVLPTVRILALVLAVFWPAAVQAQIATLQQTIPGPPQAAFGSDTAVDGNTAVIGARFDDPGGVNGAGAAYVIVRSGATWSLQQQLVASDATSGAHFGEGVAISGNTIVVGAPNARTNGTAVGAAYVFVRTGTTWTQQAKLVASDAAVDTFFGVDVDIDAGTIVVGAPSTFVGPAKMGVAYIFDFNGTLWSERRIPAPNGKDLDNFGVSVGVAGDTVCVGSSGYDVGSSLSQGAVYAFVRAGGWALQQRILAPSGASSDALGGSCDVAGNTIAAGAIGAGSSDVGVVHVFTRTGTTWTEQQALSGDNANAGLSSVGLGGDILVAGATSEDNAAGAVYIYRRSGTTWSRVQRISNADQARGRTFGSGVSTDGVSILAGAPSPSPASGSPGGNVPIYTFGGSSTGVPGAPTNFAANVAGNALSLAWGAPASGGAATGYTLIARTPAGALLVSQPIGLTTTFAATAPNGTYVLAVQATNAAGAGPESAPVTVVLPSSATPPGTPSGLTVAVSGTTAVFTWNPPSSGGAVTNYMLVAGTTSGFTVPIATATLPGTPGLSVPNVPAGTFYVRVLAMNNGGMSGPSNEVVLTVGAASLPGAPTLNAPAVNGATVQLSWIPGTGSATSYALRAYAPSGALLATVPGLTGTAVTFTGVPSGSYALELVAVNGAGASAPSNRIPLVVP